VLLLTYFQVLLVYAVVLVPDDAAESVLLLGPLKNRLLLLVLVRVPARHKTVSRVVACCYANINIVQR
jgi:hypothetical protein